MGKINNLKELLHFIKDNKFIFNVSEHRDYAGGVLILGIDVHNNQRITEIGEDFFVINSRYVYNISAITRIDIYDIRLFNHKTTK